MTNNGFRTTDIETFWDYIIVPNQDKEFTMYQGDTVSYTVDTDPDRERNIRVDRITTDEDRIYISSFERALGRWPIEQPSNLGQGVKGKSYVWAILNTIYPLENSQ